MWEQLAGAFPASGLASPPAASLVQNMPSSSATAGVPCSTSSFSLKRDAQLFLLPYFLGYTTTNVMPSIKGIIYNASVSHLALEIAVQLTEGLLFLCLKWKNKQTKKTTYCVPCDFSAPFNYTWIQHGFSNETTLIPQSPQFTRIFFHLFLETGALPHAQLFSLNHSKTSARKTEHHILTCYQVTLPCEKAVKRKMWWESGKLPAFCKVSTKNN